MWSHLSGMRSAIAYRVAAGLALIAILACSGLGLCWQQFGKGGHDCCSADEAQLSTPAKACAAPAATVLTVKVTPPPLVSALPAIAPMGHAAVCFRASHPAFAVKDPPLVLRI